MIRLAAACRNTSVKRTTGRRARADDVGQDLPGSDGRQLVDIADDEQRRTVRRRLHQRLHQHDVDHRGLVDHEQIAIDATDAARRQAGLRYDCCVITLLRFGTQGYSRPIPTRCQLIEGLIETHRSVIHCRSPASAKTGNQLKPRRAVVGDHDPTYSI